MLGLVIKKSSVLSPMLSNDGFSVSQKFAPGLSEINKKCKANFVEILFFDEKVRITGSHTMTKKVPARCLKNDFFLFEWINKQIDNAWD